MKKRRFMISSLLAAGFAVPQGEAMSLTHGLVGSGDGAGDPKRQDALVRQFAQEHSFLLAGHRSHSSHSSHSSHRSGSSGTVRAPVYTPPPPRTPKTRAPAPRPSPAPAPSSRNPRSTPPSSILPSSPAVAPSTLYAKPSAQTISTIVMRVQLALKAYGYYDGPATGTVDAATRDALRRFQSDFGLKVTGTITPEVLDAFKIAT